jgi:hypothetical protein
MWLALAVLIACWLLVPLFTKKTPREGLCLGIIAGVLVLMLSKLFIFFLLVLK